MCNSCLESLEILTGKEILPNGTKGRYNALVALTDDAAGFEFLLRGPATASGPQENRSALWFALASAVELEMGRRIKKQEGSRLAPSDGTKQGLSEESYGKVVEGQEHLGNELQNLEAMHIEDNKEAAVKLPPVPEKFEPAAVAQGQAQHLQTLNWLDKSDHLQLFGSVRVEEDPNTVEKKGKRVGEESTGSSTNKGRRKNN